MKNYIKPGDNVTVPAPADVLAGDVVLVGALLGVAQHDAASGDDVVLVRKGVFEVPKATGQAWTVGAKIYWHNTNGNFTTSSSGSVLAGFVEAAALSADATGRVLLTGQAV